jgi:lipopolysaccharide transport system ATP-binding protein
LLIDEVLAVGDQAFQRKCLERIAQFKAEQCTIILVSHDAGLVAKLCDEALWLQAGRVMARGPADEVVSRYNTGAELPDGAPGRSVATEVLGP